MSIPRTRSIGPRQTYKDYVRYHCNPTCTESSTYTFTSSHYAKTMHDRITPGYFELVKNGQLLPVNNMTMEEEDLSETCGDFETLKGSFRGHGALDWGPRNADLRHIPVNAHEADYIRSLLRTEAWSRAKAPTFDIGAMLVELDGTIDTYANAGYRVRKHAERLAKRARKRAKTYGKRMRVFQDMWLESRYGWAPEILTVLDAVEAIRRKDFAHNRGYAELTQVCVETESEDSVWTSCDVRVTTSIESVHTFRLGVTAAYDWRISTFGGNAANAWWEAVPYSFVVDWFMNVGDTLRATLPTPRVHVLSNSGWYTHTIQSQYTSITGTVLREKGGYTVPGGSPNQVKGYIKSYSRTIDTAFPTLIPAIRIDLNVTRVMDAVALWAKSRSKVMNTLRRIP